MVARPKEAGIDTGGKGGRDGRDPKKGCGTIGLSPLLRSEIHIRRPNVSVERAPRGPTTGGGGSHSDRCREHLWVSRLISKRLSVRIAPISGLGRVPCSHTETAPLRHNSTLLDSDVGLTFLREKITDGHATSSDIKSIYDSILPCNDLALLESAPDSLAPFLSSTRQRPFGFIQHDQSKQRHYGVYCRGPSLAYFPDWRWNGCDEQGLRLLCCICHFDHRFRLARVCVCSVLWPKMHRHALADSCIPFRCQGLV